MTEFVSPRQLAAQIPSGCKLGLPPDSSGAGPGITGYVIDAGCRDLHVVCAPIGGMQVDVLIGAGMVRTLETSAVSLGEAGSAPCFTRAVKSQSIRMMDATCPAIFAGLTAAQKGLPFMPIRGLIGSDILPLRKDWKVITNPFDGSEFLVAIPAIQPDVSLIHAAEADRFGNVWIGRRRELMLLASASKQTFVTVERIRKTSLLDDEPLTAGVLPSMYVSVIAKLDQGAWPTGLYGEYGPDDKEVARYATVARTPEGFQDYLHSIRCVA